VDAKVTLNADLFNAFNNNVVLEITSAQNSASANNITRLLAPRVGALRREGELLILNSEF